MSILEALDPAGNAKKNSNVVKDFWQKWQKVQGSKLNIFVSKCLYHKDIGWFQK